MPASLIIRDARFSDYRTLCSIFVQANDLHCALRPEYYRTVRPIISKKDFYLAATAQHFSFGRKQVCARIAEKDGESVGAVFAVSIKRRALGWSVHKKEACLDNIFVDEQHRRKGIGTALLHSVISWAKESGHPYLNVKIVESNETSRAFFGSAGIHTTDVVAGITLV